jgi:kynurenine 3-monooxygenase
MTKLQVAANRFCSGPVSATARQRANAFRITASSAVVSEQGEKQASESPPSSTIVVGGGPAGLSTAIMLAKRGWSGITVLERLPRIPRSDDFQFWQDPERSYNIGLNGKGQAVLRSLGCWDRIDACCADVVGRMDWTPESDEPKEVLLAEKRGYTTKVIQRDRLVSCLYEELQVRLLCGDLKRRSTPR